MWVFRNWHLSNRQHFDNHIPDSSHEVDHMGHLRPWWLKRQLQCLQRSCNNCWHNCAVAAMAVVMVANAHMFLVLVFLFFGHRQWSWKTVGREARNFWTSFTWQYWHFMTRQITPNHSWRKRFADKISNRWVRILPACRWLFTSVSQRFCKGLVNFSAAFFIEKQNNWEV